MNTQEQDNDISPLVRRWMPEASPETLREATYNFREFIAVIHGIYVRTKAAEKTQEGPGRDKKGGIGMMD